MAATGWNVFWLLTILSAFIQLCASKAHLPSYYMDINCHGILDLDLENIPAGKFKLTQRSKYRRNMDCWTTIRAPPDHRILLRFLEMDIHEFFSCDDYVQIFDGWQNGTAMTSQLCDEDEPRQTFRSSGRELTVHFHSDGFKEDDGFKLLFTSFHLGNCSADEYSCNNGYCINSRLKCNGYNNCGDNSDSCPMTTGQIVGIVIVLVVIALVVAGVCLFLRRRRRGRGRGQVLKTQDPVTIPMTAPPPPQPYGQPYGQPQYPPPGGYIPPPQMAPPQMAAPPQPYGQPAPQPYGQPAGYPSAPPPVGYPPAQGYPQPGYQQPPPQGYAPPPVGAPYPPPQQNVEPPPYQEKPPL